MGREVTKFVGVFCYGFGEQESDHVLMVLRNYPYMFEQQKPPILAKYDSLDQAKREYGNNLLINTMFLILCDECRKKMEAEAK